MLDLPTPSLLTTLSVIFFSYLRLEIVLFSFINHDLDAMVLLLNQYR